jgi:hypothetical protein
MDVWDRSGGGGWVSGGVVFCLECFNEGGGDGVVG